MGIFKRKKKKPFYLRKLEKKTYSKEEVKELISFYTNLLKKKDKVIEKKEALIDHYSNALYKKTKSDHYEKHSKN